MIAEPPPPLAAAPAGEPAARVPEPDPEPGPALGTMLDGSRVLALRLDARARVTWCNPALLALLGWRSADLLGRDWFALCVPADGEGLARLAAQAAAGTLPPRLDGEVVTRPGERRRVAWDVTPRRDADGHPDGFGLVGWDVTESREAAARRRTGEDGRRQAQRLETVSRLAGGIAHDLNNLLTVVRCSAELALASLGADHECRGDVAEIRDAAGRATELTRQLLALGRRQTLRPEVVSAGVLIASAAPLLRRSLPERVELVAVSDAAVGSVRVDRDQIEQALLALVANAREALPAGGTVRIDARDVTVAEPRPGRLGVVQPGAYVAIAVGDDGTGMTEAVQARLFEPYFTTRATGSGTGLATVFGIARQSQGHVLVESAPGRGSTFSLLLPRAEVPAAPAESPPRGGGETVLLVEDDAAVRALLRRILAREGYAVLEARHGADALVSLERHPGRIDLVMTDVVMPEMGGRELLDRVRALRPATKVVVMSGYGAGEFLQGNVRAYGTAFLAKPFTGSAMLRAVREVLDRRIA